MTTRQTFMGSTMLLLVGASLAGIAAFGPWITLTTAFGSVSLSGTDRGGDGVIVLVLAGTLLVLELCVFGIPYRPKRGTLLVDFLLSGGILATAVVDFTNVYDRVNAINNAGAADSASVGWGYYLLFAAGAVLLIGVFVRLSQINAPRVVALLPRTCSHCGRAMPADNLFCEACGHNLAQQARTA